MANLARLGAHTDAIVARLREVERFAVFDAAPPDADGGKGWGWQGTPGQSRYLPHVTVYPMPGGTFDGPMGCPDDDADLMWQVTCVGATRTQCEWALDEVNIALIGHPLAVPGRLIGRLYADMPGGGARRDDTVQPPVFIAVPRYRCMSSPAPA